MDVRWELESRRCSAVEQYWLTLSLSGGYSQPSFSAQPEPRPTLNKMYNLPEALEKIAEATKRSWTRDDLFENIHALALPVRSTTPPTARVIIPAMGVEHDPGLPLLAVALHFFLPLISGTCGSMGGP